MPGGQVRLRFAYVITCNEVIRDESGEPVELICSYDEKTRAGITPEGFRRVKGIIQWVANSNDAIKGEIRLYDRLFSVPSPGKDREDNDFLSDLNKGSLNIIPNALLEPSVKHLVPGSVVQFERLGYFCVDEFDNIKETMMTGDVPIKLNRIVTLKDTWSPKNANKDENVSSKTTSVSSSAQALENEVLRVDLRVGRILNAERHPDADSLFVERIDLGESSGPRTIISGLAKYYMTEDLVNKLVVVVANLKPAKVRGILSEGMVLCASTDDATELLTPPEGCVVGERLRVEGLGEPQPDEVIKSKSAQEMWKRVVALMGTNAQMEGMYEGKKILSSKGVCVVSSLKNSAIR